MLLTGIAAEPAKPKSAGPATLRKRRPKVPRCKPSTQYRVLKLSPLKAALPLTLR